MTGHSASEPRVSLPAPPRAPAVRLRSLLAHWIGRGLARLLGTADGAAVAAMARRELALILRSRDWHRHFLGWLGCCAAALALPLLYRTDLGQWEHPTNAEWLMAEGYLLQAGIFFFMAQWCVRRLRRDLYTDRLDELMLTRCSPADIAMGEALAAAVASLWLVAGALPVCLFLSAIAGFGPGTAFVLALSLAPAGALGVWFGMGWGLTFTFRRSGMVVALTNWWAKTPFVPVWAAWGLVSALPVTWAVLELVPGGHRALLSLLAPCQWLIRTLLWHWNPLLVMAAVASQLQTTWFTDWLVLLGLAVFMMRTSMDAIQISLTTLPERQLTRGDGVAWIHHDVHHFMEYGDEKRRQPDYRDGGNPIAAFDVALGHRVYLHPFFWCLAFMAHLFLLLWSLAVPDFGRVTGTIAVLIPATGALLLMSGGVAVSFGWERDRHRWPALAVLPIDNTRLGLGKIKGVVRPTLWVCLAASLTALVLGLRGTLPLESALWMALHVMIFPVALACVSAVLSLTTETVEDALYRWAVLGAIPTLATALPYPIGSQSGLALPFSPPLVALLLVLEGPSRELIRASWISLGCEVLGIAVSLLVLRLALRRWTVGERD
jgi:hypothetical protein